VILAQRKYILDCYAKLLILIFKIDYMSTFLVKKTRLHIHSPEKFTIFQSLNLFLRLSQYIPALQHQFKGSLFTQIEKIELACDGLFKNAPQAWGEKNDTCINYISSVCARARLQEFNNKKAPSRSRQN
jgi:hypothetical protein